MLFGRLSCAYGDQKWRADDEVQYSITCGVCGHTEDARVLVPRLSQVYLQELILDNRQDMIVPVLRNAASLRGWRVYGHNGGSNDLCPGCSPHQVEDDDGVCGDWADEIASKALRSPER